ncbi:MULTISPECIES: hypothetical protein [Delftia]|jgi:hypothetical protein|uniref:hypothetical protein n=1 Tax=Delftia acidovorans TaxID=80866 RepID=UPI00062D6B10
MTTDIRHDHYSSANYGVYMTHSFISIYKPEADLSDSSNSGALPTHVHEYLHYLQNISTTAGLTINLFMHTIMAAVVHGYRFSGGQIGAKTDERLWSDLVEDSFEAINFIRGDSLELKGPCKIVATEKFKHGGNMLGNQMGLNVTIELDSQLMTFAVGSDLINEGIAYEVEKTIWSTTLLPSVDSATPYFPYKFFGDLTNHLAGRKLTSAEKISLGVMALMSQSPGYSLMNGCKSIASNKAYAEFATEQKRSFSDFAKKRVPALIENALVFYKQSEFFIDPFRAYASIILDACKKRINNPHLERKFVNLKDSSEFLNLVSDTMPHLFIQKKYDGKSESYLVGAFNWEHRLEGKAKDHLYILCLAIHFVAQHFNKQTKIAPTAIVRQKPCPFSGDCKVQSVRGNLNTCEKRPWMYANVLWNKDRGGCWYQSAIYALMPEPRKIATDDPAPR